MLAGTRVAVRRYEDGQEGATLRRLAGGQPFVFKLGAGQVIRGWDLGLVGMKVGGCAGGDPERAGLRPPGRVRPSRQRDTRVEVEIFGVVGG